MEFYSREITVEKLGRYFSRDKFYKLLRDKAPYFCPLRVFTDQYEGFIHQNYFSDFYTKMIPLLHDQGERNTVFTLENGIRHIKDSTFVSCWTTRSISSNDMWMEYIGGDEGVFVLVDKDVLIKNLGIAVQSKYLNLHHGLVNYFDLNKTYFGAPLHDTGETKESWGFDEPDILSPLETGDFLFIKAKNYEFEQEYRIIASRDTSIDFGWWRNMSKSIGAEYATMGALNNIRIDSNEEYERAMALPPPEGILLDVPLEDVICDIYFKPGTRDDYIKDIHQLIKHFSLDTLSTKLRVGEL